MEGRKAEMAFCPYRKKREKKKKIIIKEYKKRLLGAKLPSPPSLPSHKYVSYLLSLENVLVAITSSYPQHSSS